MEYFAIPILIASAMLSAIVLALALVGVMHGTGKLQKGILQYFFYAAFFSNSIRVLLSTRDFSLNGQLIEALANASPISIWSIRMTSAFTLLACFDQIIRHFRARKDIDRVRLMIVGGLLAYWLSSILAPAFLSTHPADFQLSWTYQLVLGAGLSFLSKDNAKVAIECCRNAITAFCAVSLILIPIIPKVVLDSAYTQGYLPGVPRLAGLAPHATMLGMNASIGIWCLLAYPLESRVLQRCAIAVCGIALLLAQSKAVWITFLVGVPILFFYQRDVTSRRIIQLSQVKVLLVALLSLICMVIVAIFCAVLLDLETAAISKFATSKQGAQLISLTGRDAIWEVALQEWHAAPLFGYGLPLFDPIFRMQIGMPFATSGHNQLIDSLGRSGLVGTSGLLLYTAILLVLSIRFRKASGGLSLVLALSLLVRSISEVPITLTVLSISDTPHYLLLCVLMACVLRETRQSRPGKSTTVMPAQAQFL